MPGVPYEMQEMVERRGPARPRAARSGDTGVIVSRMLRTWGESESGLAERLAPASTSSTARGNPTIAFLASGIEGIKVRITAKAADRGGGRGRCSRPRRPSCASLLGDLVFGVDDETMEHAVGRLLGAAG